MTRQDFAGLRKGVCIFLIAWPYVVFILVADGERSAASIQAHKSYRLADTVPGYL